MRDRFKARTLIGWLQDIKDNFHLEKVALFFPKDPHGAVVFTCSKIESDINSTGLVICVDSCSIHF